MATVYFSGASISETGGINGAKGDSTGKEVRTTKAYNHSLGWRIFRYPDATIAANIGKFAKAIADNNCFGYGQSDRTTGYNATVKANYNPAAVTTKCNIDCSELVRTCVACAFKRGIADFNTASEANILSSLGFKEVTSWSLTNLQVGDIAVTKTKGHTEVVSSVVGTTTTSTAAKTSTANVVYKVYAGGKWSAECKNNTACGTDGKSIKAIMIKISDGSAIKYRAHLKGGAWLPWVTGYSTTDADNGYAGDAKTDIDAIEIKCTKYDIRYNVSTTATSGYAGEVKDATTSGSESYAGVLGKAIDKVTIRIA